jgi:hypothetical protein
MSEVPKTLADWCWFVIDCADEGRYPWPQPPYERWLDTVRPHYYEMLESFNREHAARRGP